MTQLNPNSDKTILDWRSEFKRLEGAYAPSTMKSYYADLSDFEKWCLGKESAPFPAIPSTVCAYLEDIAQRLTVATVRRRMYAISRSHKLLRLDDPTRDEDVHLTIRKIMRSKLSRPQQAKGLTYEYLLKFLEVQPDTPWGLRNRALISLGYDILGRRSELAALMTNDIEERPDGTLRLIIRRSKNDPFGMGRLAFTSRRTRDLVAEWLEWRGPYIEPLFCCIYQNRAVNRAISGDKVKAIIKHSARKCDIDQNEAEAFSAHSMRVGAAQDLLRNGHDTAAIMRAGGWKSIDVLARYLEFAEHNVWEGAAS
jgi:integrase/recombinase XerD